MRTQRSKIRAGGWSLAVALVLALAAPVAANAGPLLSGYGGPGQGNQAILGSTLIGGSGGGSGGSTGSGGSGGGGVEGAAPATTSAAGNTAQTGAATTRTNTSGGASGRGAHQESAAGKAAQPIGGELSDRSYHGFENAGGSSGLGLSAADIIYIVIAAAALAFAGLLTRRFAGTRTAKGHS
jgi:hypothetical protein